MNYYFETRDLTVGYHGKPLIKNINIGIEKGEIVTLIGPNGSGKSTILKSITKHLKTIAGCVYIGKEELEHLSYRDLSKKVAVVLTERIKTELMTCREVVASGRYPYTNRMGLLTEEDERIIDDAMEKVHAKDLSEKDFTAISDGQRQRILLARAICQEPEIIVLDEPTSFLDIRHKVELLSILRKMAKEKGTTVIMSLHEIDLAEKISDKVVCVKGDVISHFGSPEEIFTKGYIAKLYDIGEEIFNLHFGSVELPRVTGEADTFVISSGGSGIHMFRRLQKEGIPFYAGILYNNDIDYQIAKSLATEVVEEAPFMSISDAAFERAVRIMGKCSRVIVCDPVIGQCNSRLTELVEKAEKMGKTKAGADRWQK